MYLVLKKGFLSVLGLLNVYVVMYIKSRKYMIHRNNRLNETDSRLSKIIKYEDICEHECMPTPFFLLF